MNDGEASTMERGQIFETERTRLLGLATRMLADHAEAEDVVQRLARAEMVSVCDGILDCRQVADRGLVGEQQPSRPRPPAMIAMRIKVPRGLQQDGADGSGG